MNGVKQLVTKTALNSKVTTYKYGKGELSGLTANLRALVVAFSPLLYAKAYARGLKSGNAGGAFFVAAVIVVAAELIHSKIATEAKEKKKKNSE